MNIKKTNYLIFFKSQLTLRNIQRTKQRFRGKMLPICLFGVWRLDGKTSYGYSRKFFWITFQIFKMEIFFKK